METVLPDYHGFAVLALTGIALILFTRDKIPLETTSFIVLLLLIGGFQIFPYVIDGELFKFVVDSWESKPIERCWQTCKKAKQDVFIHEEL